LKSLKGDKKNKLSFFSFWMTFITILTGSLLFCLTAEAQMRVVTHSYTGDGVDNRAFTGLGFQPDVVIIKKQTGTTGAAVIRTSTMSGDNSKQMVSSVALELNLIQSLDADGFTLGNDARVNASAANYYFVAFKQYAGEMKVGSYVGDGTDNRDITGVGFQPDYVIVISGSTDYPV